jgi:hypothetical protein
MHCTHNIWLSDKSIRSHAQAYHFARKAARIKLNEMKNSWWQQKAEQLQLAAGKHDLYSFYASLKDIFGPNMKTIAPLRSADKSWLLYDRQEVLNRWVEHFSSVLNEPTAISQDAIDNIEEQPVFAVCCDPSLDQEIGNAISKMSNNKAAGSDGLPAEIFKHGGNLLLSKLGDLI